MYKRQQFTSNTWQETLGWENILVKHTSVYHPQSNPSERVMRELGRMFRTFCHKKHSLWATFVCKIEGYINSSLHESTSYSPYELMFQRRPSRILQGLIKFPNRMDTPHGRKLVIAKERLLSKPEQRKRRHDRNLKPIQYEVGHLVLIKNHDQSSALDKEIKKFFLLYDGPFEVSEVKMENAYVLVDLQTREIKGTYNAVSYTHLDVYKRQGCVFPHF